MKDHIKNYIRKVVDACGGPETFQKEWLSNVDVDVVRSFEEMEVF